MGTTLEEIARLRRAKAEIKDEIEEKGVEVPDSALLDTYDDYVRQIVGSSEPAVWGGITGDLDDQTDLKNALDAKYEKPSGGIPDTDLAEGVIPDVSGFISNVKTLGGVALSGTGDVIISGDLASGENLVLGYGTYTALVRIGNTLIFIRDSSTMTAVSTVIGPEDITVKAELGNSPKKYAGLTTAAATSYSVLFLSGTPVTVETESGFPSPSSSIAPKVALFVSDIVDNLTTNDAKVPLSAKQGKALNDILANTILYTSQSLTDAQQAQARTNIGAGTYSKPSGGIPASDLASGVIPEAEVFWATYGTTTATEIETALTAGKVVLTQESTYVYLYLGKDVSYLYFTCVYASMKFRIIKCQISDSTWSLATYTSEIQSYKVQTIVGNETNTSKYPCTKAIADYAQPKIDSTHKLDYSLIDNLPTIPTVSLNGSSTTAPSFYAPTSAGTSGYVLTSNGSGAPTWQAAQGGSVDSLTELEIDAIILQAES